MHMTRTEILRVAEQAVTVDRAAAHGEAENSFAVIASLWSSYLGKEIGASDVAALMILLKLARIQQNPQHMDSWCDVAGYAACGGEIAGAGV